MCLVCEKPDYCRGLCRSHYVLWRRHGKPEISTWIASGARMARVCEVCGKDFHPRGAEKCCSPECKRARQQARWRAGYHALPPEKKRAMVEGQKRRRRENPEQARAIDARKYARIKADPERYAQERASAREWYARNRERIQAERQAKRKTLLTTLSDEELAEWVERHRRYVREHRRRERNDQVRYERRKAYEAEYRRRRREAKATNDFAALAALLAGREAGKKVKPCVECGKPVIGRVPSAKVCSPECRYARSLKLIQANREPRRCAVCGKEYQARSNTKVCSEECRRARRLGISLEELPPVVRLEEEAICDVCGIIFHPWRPMQKGCSPDCMRIGRLKRKLETGRKGPYPPKPCTVCGKWFTPDRHCGKVCRERECKLEYKRRLERQRKERGE